MSIFTKTRSEQGNKQLLCRKITLEGIMPLMFDRYPGDNDTKLTPEQKLYFMPDGNTLAIPSNNLMSFLSAQNTPSAAKVVLESKKYKKFSEACASFVTISALDGNEDIPLLRDGQPIVFTGFQKIDGHPETCPTSGAYVQRDVARLKNGVPNPKVRPVLPCPWSLTFQLQIFPNDVLQEQLVKYVFEKGGIACGIGTWRGRFGKFVISTWA